MLQIIWRRIGVLAELIIPRIKRIIQALAVLRDQLLKVYPASTKSLSTEAATIPLSCADGLTKIPLDETGDIVTKAIKYLWYRPRIAKNLIQRLMAKFALTPDFLYKTKRRHACVKAKNFI